MNGCPHGHVCGVFGGCHPYLRFYRAFNSDLLREKLFLLKGSTLSQFDDPFCYNGFNIEEIFAKK